MKFEVKNSGFSLERLMREIGYQPRRYASEGELSAIRPMGIGGWPRFHIYAKEVRGMVVINIHLDQKQPSYGRETAHSGDYDSPEVIKEARRINEIL